MNTFERRNELISILITRRHATVKELAKELGVSERTIRRDIEMLSIGYPIYTQQGMYGGIFIDEGYNPHVNSLTPSEIDTLKRMRTMVKDDDSKILLQILRKYGPKGASVHHEE